MTYSIANIDLTIVAKQQNNTNIASFRREFLVARGGGANVTLPKNISVMVPDYQTNLDWGVGIATSGSTLQVYATGSAGSTVFWQCRALVNELTTN